ncbi:hypothetical protein ABBQ38_014605 [Trebouxia sp. C0009 RCD-2024]
MTTTPLVLNRCWACTMGTKEQCKIMTQQLNLYMCITAIRCLRLFNTGANIRLSLCASMVLNVENCTLFGRSGWFLMGMSKQHGAIVQQCILLSYRLRTAGEVRL